jgi:hypothetical protein
MWTRLLCLCSVAAALQPAAWALPADTGACEASTTLDYSRVRPRDAEFLLPREAVIDILNTDGSDLRNRTVYSSCDEFRGESSINFDEPSPGAAIAGNVAPNQASTLPPGRCRPASRSSCCSPSPSIQRPRLPAIGSRPSSRTPSVTLRPSRS